MEETTRRQQLSYAGAAKDEKSTHHLDRKMSSRHMLMLSLGGVIGTGLFLSSGYTINQAGPFGTVLAYAVGALIVYLVMMCLGELSVAMPWTGAFHVYATKFLGPGTGFTVAVLYWLTWTIALGSEFTASGIIMQQWFPSTPVWIWSSLFIAIIFALNATSVKVFAETEAWLAMIKVVAIVAFIVLGTLAMFGALPLHTGESANLPVLGAMCREPFPFTPVNRHRGLATSLKTVSFLTALVRFLL